MRPAEALTQAVAERVTELVVQALDVNALLEKVDPDALLERVDVDRLVGRTDIGSVIARSSGGVASGAVDTARSQAVGLDEFIARCAARLRRRRYPGPPGPPELLRAPAPA